MEFKTKSEKFVLANKGNWERLRNIVSKINNSGYSALNDGEVKEFPSLYRLAIGDLAEAKMLELSPDVIGYMNNIIGQAHKFLYGVPPLQKGTVKYFFSTTLPRVLLKNWRFVLVSAIIFFSSFIITYVVVSYSPEKAFLIVPKTILSQMEESYRKGFEQGRPFAANSFASSFYIQNNISVAFLSFVFGVLLGAGSIVLLLYNGLFIGAIGGYITGIGYGKNFLNFVTAHSALELIGIVVAGGAGLLLGYSIIKATRYLRKDYLKLQRENILSMVAASAIMITIAAFIEGFVSPSKLPYLVKFSIFVISLASIIFYFFVLPFLKSSKLRRE